MAAIAIELVSDEILQRLHRLASSRQWDVRREALDCLERGMREREETEQKLERLARLHALMPNAGLTDNLLREAKAYLVIPGLRSAAAPSVYSRDPHWTAPGNLRNELLNVVSKNVRSGRIELSVGRAAFDEAMATVVLAEEYPTDRDLLELSVFLKTSTYDSAYVWLARRLRLRLVTGDAGLARCAPDVAVSLEDFASGK
jgi:predicted nucleic acid-binding protein